jgi:Predicted transcriptional regulators
MDIKNNFATRLKLLREEKKMSQIQLANELKVSRVSISYYENSERTADIEFLYKVSAFFNVTTDYLIGASYKRNEDETKEIGDMFDDFKNNIDKLNYDIKRELLLDLNEIIYSNDIGASNDIIINSLLDIIKAINKLKKIFIDNSNKSLNNTLITHNKFDNDNIDIKAEIEAYIIEANYDNLSKITKYLMNREKEYLNNIIKKYNLVTFSDDSNNIYKEILNSMNLLIEELKFIVYEKPFVIKIDTPKIIEIKTCEDFDIEVVFDNLETKRINFFEYAQNIAEKDQNNNEFIKKITISHDGYWLLDDQKNNVLNNYVIWEYGTEIGYALDEYDDDSDMEFEQYLFDNNKKSGDRNGNDNETK